MNDVTVELFQWVAFVVVKRMRVNSLIYMFFFGYRLRKAMLFSKAMACTWVMTVLSFEGAEMSRILTLLGFVFSGPDAVSC